MSSVLEVDLAAMHVRSAGELPEYAETLPRTVCVENLRISATIDRVEEMLAPFGHPISYVQIPQDAVSGHSLGFAFVEFASAEAAEAVVKAAAAQAADARGVKSWRGAKDKVVCCMKAEWEKRRKKGKNKERKQERKARQRDQSTSSPEGT